MSRERILPQCLQSVYLNVLLIPVRKYFFTSTERSKMVPESASLELLKEFFFIQTCSIFDINHYHQAKKSNFRKIPKASLLNL